MTTTPLIQLRNISKAFGGRVILENASLDIRKNEITAIIGKSGGGKSVLVKHIIGLITADSGEIIFDGLPYSTMNRREFSNIKKRCSYMFQNNALFDSMTVFENIALPLREKFTFKKAEIEEKVSARRARVSEADGNALSVRVELQADCFAGVWAVKANAKNKILETGDLEEGLNAAHQIGDDYLQKQAQGYAVPDSFTHGSSAQRMRWFKQGLQTGDWKQCDTFRNGAV